MSDYSKCGWTHDCEMVAVPACDYVELVDDHEGLLHAIEAIKAGELPKISTRSGLSLLRKGGDAQDWLDHRGRVNHTTSNHLRTWFTTNVDELVGELEDWLHLSGDGNEIPLDGLDFTELDDGEIVVLDMIEEEE